MTKEQTQKAIEVMQAYIDGKEIEVLCKRDTQSIRTPATYPVWNWQDNQYSIKLEVKYRPFESADEVMEAIKVHGDWIKFNKDYCCKILTVAGGIVRVQDYAFSYKKLYENYTFADGTPFGKLVED